MLRARSEPLTRKEPPSFETQAMRDVAELIRGRRTINLYLQTAIPGELVREAVEAATWAPNHHVTEPWHFYLLGDDAIECFALAAYIEENAYRQYMAMQIGDIYEFSAEEQQACREKLWTPNLFRKTWDYYYAKLG